MPKYTIYGSDVTFYRAEVEAESLEALYEMDDDDIPYVEYDGEAIQINSVELDGKKVDTKLYSLEVLVYATAYVQANSPEEAKQLLEDTLVKDGIQDASGTWFSGRPYDELLNDPGSPIALSPAMTVDHVCGEPEKVWPE